MLDYKLYILNKIIEKIKLIEQKREDLYNQYFRFDIICIYILKKDYNNYELIIR